MRRPSGYGRDKESAGSGMHVWHGACSQEDIKMKTSRWSASPPSHHPDLSCRGSSSGSDETKRKARQPFFYARIKFCALQHLTSPSFIFFSTLKKKWNKIVYAFSKKQYSRSTPNWVFPPFHKPCSGTLIKEKKNTDNTPCSEKKSCLKAAERCIV